MTWCAKCRFWKRGRGWEGETASEGQGRGEGDVMVGEGKDRRGHLELIAGGGSILYSERRWRSCALPEQVPGQGQQRIVHGIIPGRRSRTMISAAVTDCWQVRRGCQGGKGRLNRGSAMLDPPGRN